MNQINSLSQRLQRAIYFIKKNGYAKSESEIARTIGVTPSFLNMSKSGSRTPPWDMLLKLCDHYPINFAWLRTGEGSIVKEQRELMLLKRIEELEWEIAELKK